MGSETLLQAAFEQFEAANAQDPRRIVREGQPVAYEVFYAREVARWVEHFAPAASAALRLAARCQHLGRWEIERGSYPPTRAGYLTWRAELKKLHARKAAEILTELQFPEETITRVQALNLKRDLGRDPEMQVLEDALCLVTLEHQLDELVAKNPPEKIIGILQKTWRKMSPAGHAAALQLTFSATAGALVKRALSEGLAARPEQ